MRRIRVEWSGTDGPLDMTTHAPTIARTPTTKNRTTRLRTNFNRRRLAMADSFSNHQITRWVGGWWLVVSGWWVYSRAGVWAYLPVRHRPASPGDSALRAPPARDVLALD